MGNLAPLAVAVPLLTAAAITAFAAFVGPRVDDAVGIAAAAATAVICLLLLVHVSGHTQVYWFGGWRTSDGAAIGIAFTVDPFSAALASLAAVLVTAALVFSWRYFDEVGSLFHTLMLVFLAGMVGFALTGDLFNMFVFFELMGVAAFALTAYRIEATGPLQGSINFAVTNSIGAFLVLTGIALLYGRTGALNLAQLGDTLAGGRANGLVVVAFALLVGGFLVKAAIVPFHFWLADAYAVAPAPVCVLLAGAMGELGIYAVARLYWTVFDGPLGAHLPSLRAVLVVAGVVTALVGGVMALLQRHVKRLLAFSTVSYLGMFLAGVGIGTAPALAAVGLFVLAHGLTKGSLFLAAGTLASQLGSVDELRLRGKAARMAPTGIVFVLGALSLAGLPPLGTFRGKELVESAAGDAGYGWLPVFIAIASILSTAAILRATGRIFLGWGAAEDPLLSPEPEEQDEPRHASGRSPAILLAPTVALAFAGLAIGLAPGLAGQAEAAATRFVDRPAYAATVLHGAPSREHHARSEKTTVSGVVYGLITVAAAFGLAALALFRVRLWRSATELMTPPLRGLRLLHSGHVCDYVAWLTFGVAVFGGLFAVLLT